MELCHVLEPTILILYIIHRFDYDTPIEETIGGNCTIW